MFVLIIGMLAFSKTTSYLTRPLLNVCEPFKLREYLKKEMETAAINLEFEKAAKLRDEIKFLQSKELGILSIVNKK